MYRIGQKGFADQLQDSPRQPSSEQDGGRASCTTTVIYQGRAVDRQQTMTVGIGVRSVRQSYGFWVVVEDHESAKEYV